MALFVVLVCVSDQMVRWKTGFALLWMDERNGGKERNGIEGREGRERKGKERKGRESKGTEKE